MRQTNDKMLTGANDLDLTANELIEFLRTTYDLETDSLDVSMPLFSSALLDSLNMVEMVAYLEDLVKNLVLLATLEEFKTKEGLKGAEGLKKQLPFASFLRSIKKAEEK